MIRILKDNGRVYQITLEEYLEDLHASCACLAGQGRICICPNKDRDLAKHLELLEKDGFSRAKIIDKTSYKDELISLTKRRPVLIRQKKAQEVPF